MALAVLAFLILIAVLAPLYGADTRESRQWITAGRSRQWITAGRSRQWITAGRQSGRTTSSAATPPTTRRVVHFQPSASATAETSSTPTTG